MEHRTAGENQMAYIDLHFHSIYSDGTYTFEELLYYAKKKAFSAVSLTATI